MLINDIMKREITFAMAINEALFDAMKEDKTIICYGLGIDDPKGIFGTTLGLQEEFGEDRVFDMPTSENAMTGIAIGSSLNNIRPIMVHQRSDFFLLAMDQLVNTAAKWHYIFGGKSSVPITIRLIVGQGWGNGPTHSQSFHSWFSHIPGLKVVMPATAGDAKGLLLSSIFDNNPVVFIEHRWLHDMQGEVPEGDYRIHLGKAKLVNEGKDITIVSMSYLTIEAKIAIEYLKEKNINVDLIDLRTVKPIDWDTIYTSIKKTGKLLALDIGNETNSISSEIIAKVSMDCFEYLTSSPKRLALSDYPIPTGYSLTKNFFNRAEDIIENVNEILGVKNDDPIIIDRGNTPHDVPGDWFKGPF